MPMKIDLAQRWRMELQLHTAFQCLSIGQKVSTIDFMTTMIQLVSKLAILIAMN